MNGPSNTTPHRRHSRPSPKLLSVATHYGAGLLASPLCALVLCFMGWHAINQRMLSAWLLGICLLSILQLYTTDNTRNALSAAGRSPSDLRNWFSQYWLPFVTGLLWGIGAVLFISFQVSIALQLAYFAALVATTLSGILSWLSRPQKVLAQLIPAFSIPTILLMFQFQVEFLASGLMLAFSGLLICASVLRNTNILRRLNRAMYRNSELHQQVKRLEKKVGALSADLNSAATRSTGLEERLYEQENILQSLLDKAPVAVLMTDLELRSLFLFGKLANLIQRTHGNMVGIRIGEAFAEQPTVIRAFHSALMGESTRVLWRFGERLVEMNLSSYRAHDGRHAGVMAVMIDLSEQHRVRKLQENFVANMNHQLRTPLTSVLGFMELLQAKNDEIDSGTTQDWVGSALRNARRMEALIDQVGRLEAEELGSELQTLDAEQLSDLIREKFNHYNQDNVLNLINDAAGWSVIASKALLESALSALIKNAVQHAPQQSMISITVKPVPGRATDQHIQFWVCNSGEPIPASSRPTLFDKFYTGENTDSRQVYGLGLGLYLARRAVEAMKGQIWLERSTETETLFAMRIPAIQQTELLQQQTG